MYNQEENSTIQCSIHQESYDVLNEIKRKINQGTSIGIKAKYAEELSDQVTCLIDCTQYNDQKLDCNYCRLIADLHKKTAELIINAKRLSI
jgi:hypothetical protein